ncbi:MAG: tetratricopeptide repeat protein [Verrucomicrobia bacterium]|nr:tetratricopeptide repeat protein [Verrucomicrobiota bacterium]
MQKKPSQPKASSAPAKPATEAGPSAAAALAKRVRWIAAGLFVGTLLLFARAIPHDFVNYDDPDYVTANAHVRGGLSWENLKWAMTSGEASNWHPLTWLSHELDATLFGLNPHGHHATSVVWHALNAALAFLALRRLTGALWTSAFFAALFAWHPLRVESVAWVSERKDVLSGFFWFAVLWLYAGYVERRRAAGGGGGAWKRYLLLLAAFALGLMAKPMLVTLPCVLLLLDFWPLRRTGWLAPAEAGGAGPKAEAVGWLVLEKAPMFLLVVASSWATYRVQQAGGAVTAALSADARLANAVVAVGRYLGKFLVPADLAVLYPHPGYWPGGTVAAAVAVVVALTAGAVWQVRRRPWLAVGWLWFLGTLVPVSGAAVQVGLQAMADRYTYLPMLGVQLAVLWTLREKVTTAGARLACAWGAAAALAACAVATTRQLGVWRDSGTLFDQALAATKDNYAAHDNRGLFRFKAGRTEEAMADYRAALTINPGYMNANNNLGHALAEQGRPAEAVPLYRAALKAQPGNLEVRNNLANALSDLNQLDEAMEHYEYVLARQPDHANALNGSGVVLAMQNRLPEAKARLERSLRVAPANASAHNNLGNLCSMLGQRDEALAHYRRAAELNPREPHTLYLVGALLNEQGKSAEAAEALGRALALRPNHPDTLAQLGLAQLRLGRRDEGLRALRTALQAQPGHPQATAWLKAAEEAK